MGGVPRFMDPRGRRWAPGGGGGHAVGTRSQGSDEGPARHVIVSSEAAPRKRGAGRCGVYLGRKP